MRWELCRKKRSNSIAWGSERAIGTQVLGQSYRGAKRHLYIYAYIYTYYVLIYISLSLSVSLSLSPSIYLSVCLSIYLSISLYN
jgi:hypothetical protein